MPDDNDNGTRPVPDVSGADVKPFILLDEVADLDGTDTVDEPDRKTAAETMRDGGWTAATDFDPPLGIVPTVFATSPIPPAGRVAIRASNALGVVVFWITPPEARTLAQALKRAAVDVETSPKLAVPARRLVVPEG